MFPHGPEMLGSNHHGNRFSFLTMRLHGESRSSLVSKTRIRMMATDTGSFILRIRGGIKQGPTVDSTVSLSMCILVNVQVI